MPRTLATMITITTYGTWLPGDGRGWVKDGVVLPPSPRLEHHVKGTLRWEPFLFRREDRHRVGELLGRAARRLGLDVYALCVQRWHVHVVVGPMPVPVGKVVETLKNTVRHGLRMHGPLWGAGHDKRWCFTPAQARARIDYVRRHNLEDRLPADPWPVIVPFTSAAEAVR